MTSIENFLDKMTFLNEEFRRNEQKMVEITIKSDTVHNGSQRQLLPHVKRGRGDTVDELHHTVVDVHVHQKGKYPLGVLLQVIQVNLHLQQVTLRTHRVLC